MYNNIYSLIESTERDFVGRSIQVVGSYTFNQLNTIKKIHLYNSSEYESGSTDSQGFYKFFYNINKSACNNATKNIDIDNKDIQIKAERGEDWIKAFIMRQDIINWAKVNNLGKVLNEISRQLPIYGTVVTKKVKEKEIIKLVDLRNLICDPTAESLEQSAFVIEKHFYTINELRAKKGIWQNVDEVIHKYRKKLKENYDEEINNQIGGAEFIEIYEYYGEVPTQWLEDDVLMKEPEEDDDYTLAQFIVAIDSTIDKEGKKQLLGTILSKNTIKKIPYKEVHYSRVSGRWLGKGLVEELFDAQIRINELVNGKAAAMRLSAKQLYQTRDQLAAQNVLTDIDNGEIMQVQSEITPIANEERNLAAFKTEQDLWKQLSVELSNAYEATTGETLPSGTPYSLGLLLSQNANKLFDYIRENIGIFLREIFNEWVIPELSGKLNKKHILEIVSKDDAMRINEEFKKIEIWSAIKKLVLEGGRLPSLQEIEMAEELLKQQLDKENNFLEIPEDFYDFKYSLDVIITGEQMNKAERMTTITTILQTVAQNKQILEDPVTRKLFMELLETVNVSPIDIGKAERPSSGDVGMAGQAGAMGTPEMGQMINRPRQLTNNLTT